MVTESNIDLFRSNLSAYKWHWLDIQSAEKALISELLFGSCVVALSSVSDI